VMDWIFALFIRGDEEGTDDGRTGRAVA